MQRLFPNHLTLPPDKPLTQFVDSIRNHFNIPLSNLSSNPYDPFSKQDFNTRSHGERSSTEVISSVRFFAIWIGFLWFLIWKLIYLLQFWKLLSLRLG